MFATCAGWELDPISQIFTGHSRNRGGLHLHVDDPKFTTPVSEESVI